MAIGNAGNKLTLTTVVDAEVVDITHIHISTEDHTGGFTFKCYKFVKDSEGEVLTKEGKPVITETYVGDLEFPITDYINIFMSVPNNTETFGTQFEDLLLTLLKRERPDLDGLGNIDINNYYIRG